MPLTLISVCSEYLGLMKRTVGSMLFHREREFLLCGSILCLSGIEALE
jgi:hypothetical protein